MTTAGQVTVVITYQAREEALERAVRELARLIATVVQAEPECYGITMLQDTADSSRILLYEQWASQAAFEGDHMTTPHISAFRQRAPELFTGLPEIAFWGEIARADPPE